jgi:hypothetical protein
MRDLLYFVIGILLGLICILFDGSAVMAQSTSTATGIPRFGRLRPRIRRPPRWAVETPIDPASAGRATIAVVGPPSRSQKGWSVGAHVLDKPRGHASGAGQEDQRHLSANRQEHRRLDVDKAGCPARLERHGKTVVAHATAAERRRGKDSIIQTPIGSVDFGLPITA